MRLVAELGFAFAMPYDRRVGIGGGDVPLVGWGCLCLLAVLQSLFQTPVGFVQATFQLVGGYYRVVRGVGVYDTRVNKDLAAVNETGLNALPDNALKEGFEDFNAPAFAGFA